MCGKDGGRPLPLPGTEHWGTTFVYALFKDRAGNIWIGFYGKGLYKYTDRDRGTSRLTASPVPHSPVSSIAGQQDRLLLGLFYFDRLSTREIAQALGLSESCVRQRLHRGRKRFQAIYTEKEELCHEK